MSSYIENIQDIKVQIVTTSLSQKELPIPNIKYPHNKSETKVTKALNFIVYSKRQHQH